MIHYNLYHFHYNLIIRKGTCRISNCKHTASTNNGLCNKCLHDENVKRVKCFCGKSVVAPYHLGYCSNHVKRLEPNNMEELETYLKNWKTLFNMYGWNERKWKNKCNNNEFGKTLNEKCKEYS